MFRGVRMQAVALVVCLAATGGVFAAAQGPLRVSGKNPRYFTDGSGKAVLLTGSHVWYNLVDMGLSDPPQPFDYSAYLDWLEERNHNCFRLWAWELVKWDTTGNNPQFRKSETLFVVEPHPWVRTGPGNAQDGKPKFDLTKHNAAYFDRLRERVAAAQKRGMYPAIMLFEGWGLQRIKDGFRMHPFHPDNNINGIDGDQDGDGVGVEIHTLGDKKILAIQEDYVKKVIDTVNDLDNVLYEISNENHPESTEWQYHMIDFIHKYEQSKPKQHPVGMTFQYKGGSNKTLFDSPADWISPNPEGGYRDDPPAADGSKVVVTDTDHLWGIGGDRVWAWKSFCRGLNPIFMDPYDGVVLGAPKGSEFESLRRNLGHIRRYANRMNLLEMKPLSGLSSTRYCLANPGSEYLVYNPSGKDASIRVRLRPGAYRYEWFNPGSGKTASQGSIETPGGEQEFTAPFSGDAVLCLKKQD